MFKFKELVTPVVHLSGSGREALIREASENALACRELAEKLGKNFPHGRDYYIMGDGIYKDAREAFQERVDAIWKMAEEFENMAIELAEGSL